MFVAELRTKFYEYGLPFSSQSRYHQFTENKRVIAEADLFLQNSEYAMPVEVKTKLTIEFVKDHLERIERIRQYFDRHGDKRKLLGAVAGGTVPDNVLAYAQKNGLYVVVQSGESVMIADAPEGFKAREW